MWPCKRQVYGDVNVMSIFHITSILRSPHQRWQRHQRRQRVLSYTSRHTSRHRWSWCVSICRVNTWSWRIDVWRGESWGVCICTVNRWSWYAYPEARVEAIRVCVCVSRGESWGVSSSHSPLCISKSWALSPCHTRRPLEHFHSTSSLHFQDVMWERRNKDWVMDAVPTRRAPCRHAPPPSVTGPGDTVLTGNVSWYTLVR